MSQNLNEKERSVTFIKKKFAEYYKQNSERIKPPECINEREFGFLLFEEGIMVRHKGFKTVEALRNFIKTTVPSSIYYSTAYYEKPEAPMNDKKWRGADLIFDIDADHLETSCKELHDKIWVCEECLDEAKKESTKLINMLISDFGISPNNLRVNFSGHRGYHLHVNAQQIIKLGSNERKEIVDYVLGIGLNLETYKRQNINFVNLLRDLKFEESGWKGRIARGFYELSQNPNEKGSRNDWNIENYIKNNRGSWKKILSRIIDENSVKVDTVVTIDTHRLIRLPETLHGKSGFRVVQVDINRLEDFDPFKDATALKGMENIYVLDAPKFRIGTEEFGPYDKERVTLPTAGAALLICKGKAILED